MTYQPRVADISHHNTVHSFTDAANSGIWAIIHKATQGINYRDPKYLQNRKPANDAGLNWGAYHFGDSSDPVAQVTAFLAYAQPGPDTLLALDYEDHPNGRSQTMRPEQMVKFLRELLARTGRKAVLYSGNRIKEDIGKLSQEDRDFVNSHLLWLCQYGPRPQLPPGFTRSFLWQFTDGNVGPEPHSIPGISGQVDLNLFNGTREELDSAWSAVHEDLSQPSGDVVAKPPRGSDDDGPSGLPPFLQAGRPKTGGLNVQPVRAKYDVNVEIVQRHLEAMGYHEVGDVDGLWGGKTAAAIAAFLNDRGVQGQAVMGQALNDAISDAIQDNWRRPISPVRANATPADLAPKNDAVKVSRWQAFWAKIGAGGAALGFTGSSVSGAFSSVQSTLQPIHDAFSKVPPEVWFGIIGIVAVGVWYASTRAAASVTKDFNSGRLNS